MANTVIEHDHGSGDSGMGAVGIIAIIIVVLLAAFLIYRYVGRAPAASSGPSVNVTVPSGGNSGGTSGGGSTGGGY